MRKPVVVYDACVLYPAPLRDTLLSLAVTGLFQARWTDEIHDEWIRNLLLNRPELPPERLARTRAAMNKAVPDALVRGYEALVETLHLPDPDDRHVLAAAIHAKASLIITFNRKDFPESILLPLSIETCHPDKFIANLIQEHSDIITDALQKQRVRLTNPSVSVETFLATLLRQGLEQTAELLRPYSSVL